MIDILERINEPSLATFIQQLQNDGFGLLNRLITDAECDELINQYHSPSSYRKSVVMERYGYGLGEYKYFSYPLPALIESLRKQMYPLLVPIANTWMDQLHKNIEFPGSHDELLKQCAENGQLKPTALILKYHKGGFNKLHQDLYGDIFFPMQLVIFLSEPGRDYTGGEFVLMQQEPRAQSKAIVLQPKKGDVLVFTTNYRAAKGKNRYFKANMKHGVSEVHYGERFTLGLIFHDALS